MIMDAWLAWGFVRVGRLLDTEKCVRDRNPKTETVPPLTSS